MPFMEHSDAPAASEADLDALAEASFGEPEETAPAPEPSAAEPTVSEPEAPEVTTEGPAPEPEPQTYTFQPFEIELDGEKRRIESSDDVAKAFKVVEEHGRHTRRAATEREKSRLRTTELEDELKLVREQRSQDEELLGKLKNNKELLEYINQETGVEIDPDKLALRQELAEFRQRLDRDDMEKTRVNNIGVLNATRRESFGYTDPVNPREIHMLESYAESSELGKPFGKTAREVLYSHPLITAGVYTVLVGMGHIPPPMIPSMVTEKPDVNAEIKAEARKNAANIPPSTSGAPASPKPYSHRGKTPNEVLRDMKAAGEKFGGEEIPDEVLEVMGG